MGSVRHTVTPPIAFDTPITPSKVTRLAYGTSMPMRFEIVSATQGKPPYMSEVLSICSLIAG